MDVAPSLLQAFAVVLVEDIDKLFVKQHEVCSCHLRVLYLAAVPNVVAALATLQRSCTVYAAH